jgi:hypothetical protein
MRRTQPAVGSYAAAVRLETTRHPYDVLGRLRTLKTSADNWILFAHGPIDLSSVQAVS